MRGTPGGIKLRGFRVGAVFIVFLFGFFGLFSYAIMDGDSAPWWEQTYNDLVGKKNEYESATCWKGVFVAFFLFITIEVVLLLANAPREEPVVFKYASIVAFLLFFKLFLRFLIFKVTKKTLKQSYAFVVKIYLVALVLFGVIKLINN